MFCVYTTICSLWLVTFSCIISLSSGKFRGNDSSYFSEPDTLERVEIQRKKLDDKISKNFVPLVFEKELPTHYCEVIYNTRKRHVRKGKHYYVNTTYAEYGNRLTIADTFNKPTINFEASPDKFYTILMIDVDSPAVINPIYRSWLHWFVANIPGHNASVENGETLVEYVGAWPLYNSGRHRYAFLLYEHQERIEYQQRYLNVTDFIERRKFSNINFEKQYGLGIAFTMNYFKVKNDRTVIPMYTNFPLFRRS